VVRRRYAGILLGARDAVEAAGFDYGHESPLEVMRRLEGLDVFKGRTVRLPDLVVVDGGKGQLSSAYKELVALGLGDLPLIGLAKEREEIFRPGESLPVVLPHERGGLRLLQRIRDEAHRFANGYHQMLMKRRVEESILDDCPGVSERRKIALLKAFGSVARLRKATAEDIGKVAGVGAKLAEQLVAFLQTHRR
jgi:excinuclease ABC subunit C